MTPVQHIAIAIIDLIVAVLGFAAFMLLMATTFGLWFSMYENAGDDNDADDSPWYDTGWNR